VIAVGRSFTLLIDERRTSPMPELSTRQPLVTVDDLSVGFELGTGGLFNRNRPVVHAVDNVSFEIMTGETLGLVGESGSGKTTTGRAILHRVRRATITGRIIFRGQDVTLLHGEPLRRLRRHMQMVFQDPYGSLNDRMSILEIVAEPLVVHGLIANPRDAREKVNDLLQLVGLPPDAAKRYPHAFSGGQRQRIGIARALALEPEFIVADEPVSALDVSIRAQVINLMQDLQSRLGLTYLFIAHDLAVVRHICDRIAIMYAGQIVELADAASIYARPRHPYTRALLSAVPTPDPDIQATRKAIVLTGSRPNPLDPPSGCRFHTRCPHKRPTRCETEVPLLRPLQAGTLAACHWAEEIEAEFTDKPLTVGAVGA
jgi:oligopeptide/dipeptide ABC transporter ATP-binding protein